jgi:hypothetical protein
MLSRVYRGQICHCSPDDVVFAVFQSNTHYKEPLRTEHAAIFNARKSILINQPSRQISVLEVRDPPDEGIGPKGDYEAHLACEKRNHGSPITAEARTKIILEARSIVRRGKELCSNYETRECCGWELRRYKYVAPNPNDPDIAEELYFSCAGFVEYCYERANEDIVKDPPCFKDHETNECHVSSVSLYRDRHLKQLIHRLYPGYLIRAFDDDVYPFDFCAVRGDGMSKASVSGRKQTVARNLGRRGYALGSSSSRGLRFAALRPAREYYTRRPQPRSRRGLQPSREGQGGLLLRSRNLANSLFV